jgi:hypothetical protein
MVNFYITTNTAKKNCICIMLCHCCRRSYNSSLQILLNFEHNDPWHRIKVTMDLGYCSHTHFQTRGPKVQKLMFLLFVHGEFI